MGFVATVFFIVIALILAGLILGLLFPYFHHWDEKRNCRKKVYQVLKDYAEENDQLLINDVSLYLDDARYLRHFDHILLCSKYVYLIQDINYEGGIYGNLDDERLFLRKPDGNISTIENPVMINIHLRDAFARYLNVPADQCLFVSVVVYNDNLFVPGALIRKEQGNFFLTRRELCATINNSEHDEVADIQANVTEDLVQKLKDKSDMAKAMLEEERRSRKA